MVQQQPQCCQSDRAVRAFKRDEEVPEWVVLTSYFRRYYFVVEEDNTPLSVTVTPCDAPLEWKLTLQELPEEASGEGSGITDTRQPWKRLMTRYVEISLSTTHR